MIPLRLEIQNFLAYRTPAPLDFSGVHVAVLCGDNGAGKSSLLDAITWALWGKARAKTDAELIHQGMAPTEQMRVEFAFRLGDNDYRVTRARKAKGATLLDLQARAPEGKWNSLTEATVPKTQQKIIATLRMEYETFVNSAYLMQGHADEFTSKSPTQRKTVLADILQLQRWEKYEDRAKDRARKHETQINAIDLALHEIEQEQARRPLFARELADAQTQVIAVGERLRQAEAGWAQIDAARQAMVALDRQIEDLTRRLREAERDLATLEAEWHDAQKKADVAAMERELRLAQNRLTELERREAERDQLADARQRQSELSASLTEQNKAAQEQANELKKRLEWLRAEGDRARNQWQATLAEAEATARKRLEALQNDFARLKNKRLADLDLEASRALKRATTLREAAEPRCPTCGQALDDTARADLLRELELETVTRREIVERDLHDETQVLEARLLEIDIELRERRHAVETALNTEAEARHAQAAELEADIEARREQYRQNLAQIKTLGDDLARLEKDLAQANAALREKPAALQAVAEWQAALSQSETAQARVTALGERRQRWLALIEADKAKRVELDRESEQYTAILRDSAAKQRALDQLRHEDTLTKAQLGAAQQKLAALDDQAKLRDEKGRERQRLAEEKGLYDELREAFSKKGVPALMIEAAVPEIEAAANHLLSRMTDGRMHVRFNTQRETLAGDVRETLDIQIADELGTRAYELYSGGEAFRVNFAIRVALSQLLARRAGTQLQTLIVDEGFGVLDAQGREHLVQAINSAQDDFARILVVTHIDELKDAFPARIEITKTAQGSEIVVK
jgi:exonuclease SbcC